jgi:predicted ATPase/DNA-binding XRE family transcriptional regulator
VPAFADLLRSLREARLLTQEGLAERAGLTVKAVGALERGERLRPYPYTVRSLADALALDDDERAALVAAVPPRSGARVPAEPVPVVPGPVAPMIGRDAELDALVAAVRAAARPVVTLTGPGGVGKTTLALAAAARVGPAFPGGIVVVEAAALTTAPAVLRAVAGALGVPEAGFGGGVTGLVPYLAGRRVLLVLDNVEQVLDCAPDVAGLVRHCPDLVVLATSRAPLRIRAEQEVRVAPLEEAAAVALFRERLGTAGPVPVSGPEVVALCRRLDGLPLALELAASAAAVLGPSALRDHLDAALADGPRDLPERQRSMRATLAWSLALVGAPERTLLARLSVVPGGFSPDAADAVAGGAALGPLRHLVEHSLVTRAGDVRGTARFRLLEPVRQHVAGLLTDDEREAALSGMTEHVLRLARSVTDDVKGPDPTSALDLLEADVGQVRTAFHRLVDRERCDEAADLVWRLWLVLAHRGHGREGLVWLARLGGCTLGDGARIRRDIARSGLAFLVGDVPGQRRCGEAALALARRAGREDLAAEAGVLTATAALFSGDLGSARDLVDAAQRHAARAELRWLQAHALIVRGQVALAAREPDVEDALLAALAAAREVGNPFTVGMALNVLATHTALRGDHQRAAALLAESAELTSAARMGWTLAYTLPALAAVAVRMGRAAAGARLFGASASYSAHHDVAASFPAGRDLADAELATARQRLGGAAFTAAWDAGRQASVADVVDLARDLIRDGPG